MAAHAIFRSEPARTGLQPFDPGRHMAQVADLVATVFAEEIDARGRSALREMRWVGRLSPVLGGMLSMALLNESFSGQVWLEEGRVVGNVTLQEADPSGSRWRISNVAVAPAYRGRGIARAMMRAVVSEIAQRGGHWALLQVRAENKAAYQLYRELRFEDIARSGIWRLSPPPYRAPEVDPSVSLEPLRGLAGDEWLALARDARSSLSQWIDPIRAPDYQLDMGRLLGESLASVTGLQRVTRWGARRDQRLIGVVETRACPLAGHDTLRLTVHPEARGQLEAALLARGLASLARPAAQPVTVEHDGEHQEATAALRAAGFRIQRDLITMRRAVTHADAAA